MAYDLRFVDSIASSPTTRLDLYGTGWTVRDTTSFGMPELKRAVAGATLLTDGETYPAAAYSNRTLRLELRIDGASDDAIAALFQDLMTELDRPSNILRYKTDTTDPVFFRTFRAGPENVDWRPYTKELTVLVPAEPFAYGIKETLSAFTVYNDPAEGTTLNSNPFFETDASGWTALGGTVARSTAQAHEGAASLLLTPDGVTSAAEARSENVSATTGVQYRASAWVRCAVARTVSVGIVWRDAANGFLSSSLSSVSVAANTWTLIDGTATAPASTAFAQITVTMGSTPPASNLLYIDEARLRQVGSQGAMYFDLTGIRGDVETPLYLSLSTVTSPNFVTSTPDSSRVSAIAVRRRGTPSAAPFALQAESMSMGTDTTVQANSSVMSGSGSNWTRTTFATATMQTRLSIATWPSSVSVDVRGQYRVFMRYRQSAAAGSPMQARLQWGTGNAYYTNDTVSLVQNDGGAGGPYMKYADLGIVQFPQGYDPMTDGPDNVELAVEGMAFAVQAARTSGAASLDIDMLLFVPADDRLLLSTWPASPTLPITLTLDSDRGQIYTEGTSGLLGRTGAQLAGGPPMVSPGVTNRVTFVRDVGTTSSTGSGAQGDDITASTVLSPYYWPRYGYVRGVGG